MKDVQIYQQKLYSGGREKGKVAILWGGTTSDTPVDVMTRAVETYVGHDSYMEFVDKRLNQPWLRVIIKGINDIVFSVEQIANHDVHLYEQTLYDDNNEAKGKMAILISGINSNKPTAILNQVVLQYTQGLQYNELVEKHLDNLWLRVIITNINELKFANFINQRLS